MDAVWWYPFGWYRRLGAPSTERAWVSFRGLVLKSSNHAHMLTCSHIQPNREQMPESPKDSSVNAYLVLHYLLKTDDARTAAVLLYE